MTDLLVSPGLQPARSVESFVREGSPSCGEVDMTDLKLSAPGAEKLCRRLDSGTLVEVLLQSCEQGQAEALSALLQELQKRGELSRSLMMQAFMIAVKEGRVDVLDALLICEKRDDAEDVNALIVVAAESGQIEVLERLLKEPYADPASEKNAAIIGAATAGHSEIVKILLDYPTCDPTDQCQIALLRAVANGHFEVIQVLVENSLIDITTQENLPLRLAASAGHVEIVRYILGREGFNASDCDEEALITAATSGHIGVICELLEKDVDITAKDCYAVRGALHAGHIDIAFRLLSCVPDRCDIWTDTVVVKHRPSLEALRSDVVKIALLLKRLESKMPFNALKLILIQAESHGLVGRTGMEREKDAERLLQPLEGDGNTKAGCIIN